MNHRLIFRSVGHLLCIEAGCMAPCLIVALLSGQGDARAFCLSIAATLLAGLLLRGKKPESVEMFARDGLVIVGFGWLALSVFGMLPFLLSGTIARVEDALFEVISGLTTTGASILSDVESVPRGVLFWRSFTHFLGGMGFLVLMVAILPSAKANTVHMLSAESPGPSLDKFVPHIGQVARILYTLYASMTALETVLLLLGGLPLFDALTISFGTAGTGGFSVRNAGIAAYGSAYVEMVVGVFMMLFGVNFSLFFLLFKRRIADALRDEELRLYLGIIAVTTALIMLNIRTGFFDSILKTFRSAFFQVTSIITTTGYASTNFDLWPTFSRSLLVLLMFIGASAGSTGGGIKCVRILLLLKAARREINKRAHPEAVRAITLNGKPVQEKLIADTLAFFFLYIAITALAILIVSLDNLDLVSSASAVFATVSNIGHSLSIVGPTGNFSSFSPASKLVLSLCMVVGRLEVYPVLILFFPAFWKRMPRRRGV